jgi:hypothetical protein
VIGSASDMVGVWIEPVIAQLMMILFAIGSFLPRPGAGCWAVQSFAAGTSSRTCLALSHAGYWPVFLASAIADQIA